MHTAIAVLSAAMLTGLGAGAGAREGARAATVPGERSAVPLTACHPVPGPADVATLESHVAAWMPRHGRALHHRLATAIHDESRHAGLDPLLVLALIRVESAFDPGAVSEAGAVGLMQLLEPTMRQEIERSGLTRYDPRDPVANVRAGVRYLRRLVTAFGSTDLGLMAYNAGPHRIGAYRRAGGIPKRFYGYPRRVQRELQRLKARSDSR